MTTSARTLADSAYTLLKAVANLNVYRGDFVDDQGNELPPPLDTDGRVHPYAIAYFGPGRAVADRVCATPSKLAWSFQVTVAGGDDTRALWAADKVRAALTGVRVGGSVIREATDPGPLQRTDDVKPARYWMPLLFDVYVCG